MSIFSKTKPHKNQNQIRIKRSKEDMRTVHLILVCLMLLNLHVSSAAGLHPVILVPGSGGNQLEARLTDAYKPSSLFCSPWVRSDTRKGKWYRIWFELSLLLPPLTNCFSERMTLQFRRDLDDFRNVPGVQTRVPYFGSTQGLLYLDPNLKHISEYMVKLVESLEDIGYKDGENLFGAPYDFRYGLAAKGHPSLVGTRYLADLKALIENASESNGGKPVIVVSHSLGSLFVLNLLNRNPSAWREKYVKHFVTLSAPWGGSVQEMLTYASGYTLGIPFVNPLTVRDEQRSSESNMWLLPSPTVFDDEDYIQPLVITVKRNYTASDMVAFLQDIGYPEGIFPYETRILPLVTVEQMVAPMVPVTCFVGSGVDTPEVLVYGKDGFDEQPEIKYGDGDGTVNMKSLLAVEKEWKGVEGQRLKVIKLPSVSHTDILKDDGALLEIKGEISEINKVTGNDESLLLSSTV